jgi:hypothetical protein
MKEDWLNAVHHFSKAIADHNRINGFVRTDDEVPKLSKEQHLKATIQLEIASRKVSDQWSHNARHLFNETDRFDDKTFDDKDKWRNSFSCLGNIRISCARMNERLC